MSLGDRWGSETLPTETSVIAPDYWRSKALEFQQTLNAVDQMAQESWRLAEMLPADSIERAQILQGLAEFDERRVTMKMTAEAINLGAATVNAIGGRFPVLSIPQSLGIAFPVMPVAAAAALTAAAGLVTWGVAWCRVQLAHIRSGGALLDRIEDPTMRAEVASETARILARAEAAAASTDNPLASIADLLKWGGIAVLALFAYRTFANR